MMVKVGFIVNGKKRRAQRFQKELDDGSIDSNITCLIRETHSKGHGILLTQELINEGCSHIIAVGGDGTLHEVVNGVMRANQNTVVGLLRNGTANDFSKSFSIPRSLNELLKAISNGKTEKIDVGMVESTDALDDHVRYFINIASAGMSAGVVEKVEQSGSWLSANVTFFMAIIRTFLSYKNLPVKATAEGWSWEGNINTMAFANGKYFGSGLCIAPQAELKDGQIAVTVIGDVNLFDYLKYTGKLKRGKFIQHPKVKYLHLKNVALSSLQECCMEADGELIGKLPLQISILPQAVRMIKS